MRPRGPSTKTIHTKEHTAPGRGRGSGYWGTFELHKLPLKEKKRNIILVYYLSILSVYYIYIYISILSQYTYSVWRLDSFGEKLFKRHDIRRYLIPHPPRKMRDRGERGREDISGGWDNKRLSLPLTKGNWCSKEWATRYVLINIRSTAHWVKVLVTAPRVMGVRGDALVWGERGTVSSTNEIRLREVDGVTRRVSGRGCWL